MAHRRRRASSRDTARPRVTRLPAIRRHRRHPSERSASWRSRSAAWACSSACSDSSTWVFRSASRDSCAQSWRRSASHRPAGSASPGSGCRSARSSSPRSSVSSPSSPRWSSSARCPHTVTDHQLTEPPRVRADASARTLSLISTCRLVDD
ncbi:hypothetical protein ACFPRL_25410 [Pseudoclavibacter helvolus]